MIIRIITGSLCCAKYKTRTAEVTICIISERLPDRHDSYRMSTRSRVYRDPKAAQRTSKTECGEQVGGNPKASTTASGSGNQFIGGDLESNRSCPGPRAIYRKVPSFVHIVVALRVHVGVGGAGMRARNGCFKLTHWHTSCDYTIAEYYTAVLE